MTYSPRAAGAIAGGGGGGYIPSLPAGWGAKRSRRTGQLYYVDLQTGRSTYRVPDETTPPQQPPWHDGQLPPPLPATQVNDAQNRSLSGAPESQPTPEPQPTPELEPEPLLELELEPQPVPQRQTLRALREPPPLRGRDGQMLRARALEQGKQQRRQQ
eukprot:COSAG01_NODE_31503_length_596_cov_1.112676_2_plen_157_part_01